MKRYSIAAAAFAVALSLAVPRGPAFGAPLAPQVTPSPIPIESASRLPYPAYGTPAPGVSRTQAQPGVPARLTLQQAIDIAVARSPVLASARAAFAQTQASLDLARTGLLPNVGASATIGRGNSSGGGSRSVPSTNANGGAGGASGGTGAGGTGAGSNGGQSQQFTLGGGGTTSESLDASIRQLIFDGGRTRAQIEAASQGVVAGANTFRRNLQTLAFNVATNYFNALQAEATVALDQQIVAQNVEAENLVIAQIRAGTAPRAQIATAAFPVAQARTALVRAQGTELTALAAFANSIGLNANADVRPSNAATASSPRLIIGSEPLDYDAALARAMLLRPDYLAASSTVLQSEYSLHAARLGRFPTVSGTASLGLGSTSPSGGSFRTSNSVGASLNIPVFDQGITAAQVEQANATLANAQANLLNSELTVELNVRQALVNLVSAEAAVTQADAELVQASESLRATRAQYRAGVTTLPLLLNAEVALTQAQTDRLNAIYGLRQAEQNYLYALGESDISTLNV